MLLPPVVVCITPILVSFKISIIALVCIIDHGIELINSVLQLVRIVTWLKFGIKNLHVSVFWYQEEFTSILIQNIRG